MLEARSVLKKDNVTAPSNDRPPSGSATEVHVRLCGQRSPTKIHLANLISQVSLSAPTRRSRMSGPFIVDRLTQDWSSKCPLSFLGFPAARSFHLLLTRNDVALFSERSIVCSSSAQDICLFEELQISNISTATADSFRCAPTPPTCVRLQDVHSSILKRVVTQCSCVKSHRCPY